MPNIESTNAGIFAASVVKKTAELLPLIRITKDIFPGFENSGKLGLIRQPDIIPFC
ncbi:MAG: hypothetical protein WCS42_00705 [Verrucomicrobiota bacterium]